jgi:ATP-dependent protease ClpP protease subunit
MLDGSDSDLRRPKMDILPGSAGVPTAAAAAPPPPPVVYISFSAEINAHTTESLLAVAARCVEQKVGEVCLMISTPGGNVMNGMNIYNVLRAMPFKLITHNVGNVDSIGNVIFLAGETRYASPHSTFMFHGVAFDSVAGVKLDERLLKERLNGVLTEQGRIASIIAERTKGDPGG